MAANQGRQLASLVSVRAGTIEQSRGARNVAAA
jgi:hypothetical protein